MKETCIQFGEHRELAGIITEPLTRVRKLGCVLVNAGLVAKAGPFRIYVQLARQLARDGFVTLRFDLGGIGESRQAHQSLPLLARTASEICAAVDELTTRQDVEGVILGGVCSGAEDAFRHAEHDPRVRGVVLIEPFSYPTTGSKWRSLVHRTARRALLAAGLYEPIMPTLVTTPGNGLAKIVSYRYMERSESTRILRAMIAREARVHFIYTGQETFTHRGQLAEMFAGIAFDGVVTVDHFPHMDHTQLLDEDRRTMVEAIGRRLTSARP